MVGYQPFDLSRLVNRRVAIASEVSYMGHEPAYVQTCNFPFIGIIDLQFFPAKGAIFLLWLEINCWRLREQIDAGKIKYRVVPQFTYLLDQVIPVVFFSSPWYSKNIFKSGTLMQI